MGSGQIVVALIDEEATCKRYYPEGDTIRFQPLNPKMIPLLVRKSDFRSTMILGVVVGMYRQLKTAGRRDEPRTQPPGSNSPPEAKHRPAGEGARPRRSSTHRTEAPMATLNPEKQGCLDSALSAIEKQFGKGSITRLVRTNALDVVAIDSVAALVPKEELEDEMGDAHRWAPRRGWSASPTGRGRC